MRALLLVTIGGALFGQQIPLPPPPKPSAPQQEAPEPPEEDASLKPTEYSFNPVQAKKEISAGNFYMKKANYLAAATRFQEASRWDPGSTDAFLKLGEASEKARNYSAAKAAYTKYFEMSEDQKLVEEIKKRMAKWPKNARPVPDKKPTAPLTSVPNLDPPPPRSHR